MKNREQIALELLQRMLVELKVIRDVDSLLDVNIIIAAEEWLEDKKIRNNTAQLWRDSAQFDYDYQKARAYVIKNLQRNHNLTENCAAQYFAEFFEG